MTGRSLAPLKVANSTSNGASFLQRTCSKCGGKAGIGGTCSACRRKRWVGPSNRLSHVEASETLQAKLTINEPGDRFEREADRVAAEVMRMPEPGTAIQRIADSPHEKLQRRCAKCREEDEELQTKPAGPQSNAAASAATPGVPGMVHDVLNSAGRPLDAATQQFMESRFGHNFGQVRIHTDAKAARSAEAIHAAAYTVKQSIVFGANRFAPHTLAGKQLLAHELAHVIQQSGGLASGIQRQPVCENDPATAPPLSCNIASFSPAGTGLDVLFAVNSPDLQPAAVNSLQNFVRNWHAAGGTEPVTVHGFASCDGDPDFNWRLSCDRAFAVAAELLHPSDGSPGIDPTIFVGSRDMFANGETDSFDTNLEPNRRVVVTLGPATPSPSPTPTPAPAPSPAPAPTPVCPAVPATTPGSCAARHTGYCDAAACFPSDPWLQCVCMVSGQICDAIEAFDLRGAQGTLLEACLFASRAPTLPVRAKGRWFLATNRCIWGHWRHAFEALHDPSVPVPSGLTPQWVSAVSICRTKGMSSKDCCDAQVKAEQHAIDTCGGYPSATLGLLPTDVPGAPTCSLAASIIAPGPPFTGDFGKVADRIAFGESLCCP